MINYHACEFVRILIDRLRATSLMVIFNGMLFVGSMYIYNSK